MLPPSEFLAETPKKSTKSTYNVALKRYLEIILNKKISQSSLDKSWDGYFSINRDYGNDILLFSEKCRNVIQLAPKTSHLYYQIVLMYLKYCGIEIPASSIRRIKNHVPKNRPISREAELTKELIRRITEKADIRLKAEILIAASSGMRIGEILRFKISDINFSSSPAEIYLSEKITKNGVARRVFISDEASSVLNEWLCVRDKEIKKKGRRGSKNERCFPYSLTSEISKFRNLLINNGLCETDSRTKRTTVHFHMFRKFFLTEFKLAASEEAAEELAGHEGYLSSSYRRLTASALRAEYKKAEPRLTVNSDFRDDTGLGLDDGRNGFCGHCMKLEEEVMELKLEIRNLAKEVMRG